LEDEELVFDDGHKVAEITKEEKKIASAVSDFETRLNDRKQAALQQKEQALAEIRFLEEKVKKRGKSI
jgi:hypothetical protein